MDAVLTEAQVAAAKAWRPLIDWRTVDFRRERGAAAGGREFTFRGGLLDGEVRALASPAPSRLVLHGDPRRRPVAWNGKASKVLATADVYDLDGAGVYVFVRTAKRGTR